MNFLRRRNGQTALVGRTSDVLRMEKLLIQEHSSEACRYFEPKVHFAEFSSLSELIEHLDGLKAGLGKYRKIRKEGAQFFKENYSDIEVLRHLITWL